MADDSSSQSQPGETPVNVGSVHVEVSVTSDKPPKRVLYFSDGVLEESSSDESEDDTSPVRTKIDPSMLAWTPWCLYYISMVARKSFSAAETCGEKLAWLLGITAPKYGYALEEYKRMERELAQEQERDQKLYEESQGMSPVEITVRDGKTPITSQQPGVPHPSLVTEKY